MKFFQWWLLKTDRKFQKQNKRIVLFNENCTAHKTILFYFQLIILWLVCSSSPCFPSLVLVFVVCIPGSAFTFLLFIIVQTSSNFSRDDQSRCSFSLFKVLSSCCLSAILQIISSFGTWFLFLLGTPDISWHKWSADMLAKINDHTLWILHLHKFKKFG